MSSRKIEDLIPEMQSKVQQVLDICSSQGVDLLITCTLRSLEEQAQLYAQTRPVGFIDPKTGQVADVKAKQNRLRQKGFGFLADVFDTINIKYIGKPGKHVTCAGPGESFHNYREAVDVVPLVNGKPQWEDTDKTVDEWQVYGDACVSVGLDWAGNWPNFKEFPHCQFRKGSNPLLNYSPGQLHEILVNNGLLKK